MSFKEATQAEILRAAQKDDFVISKLKHDVNEIFREAFGVQQWLTWHEIIQSIVEFLYFAHTTLVGSQTLGEEYVNVIQVDPSKVRVPSIKRRLWMVGLHVFSPRLADIILLLFEKWIPRTELWKQIRPELRIAISNKLPFIHQVIMVLHRLHLTLFYLRGTFYHSAKRITKVKYVLIRRWLGDVQCRPVFHILAALSAVQLVIAISKMKKSATVASSGAMVVSPAPSGSKSVVSGKDTCSLCWEVRNRTTSTPCGHLFCWDCILMSASTKSECPLCREKFNVSRLIPLQNYDDVLNQ